MCVRKLATSVISFLTISSCFVDAKATWIDVFTVKDGKPASTHHQIHSRRNNTLFPILKAVRSYLKTSPEGLRLRGPCYELSHMQAFFLHNVMFSGYDEFFKTENDALCTVQYSTRVEANSISGDTHDVEPFQREIRDAQTLAQNTGVAEVLNDVLTLLDWTDLCVLYSDAYGSYIEGVTGLVLKRRPGTIVRHFSTASDSGVISAIRECIISLRDTYKNFILIAEKAIVDKVQRAVRTVATDFQGFLLMSKWLIVGDQDVDGLLDCGIQNLARLQTRIAPPAGHTFQVSTLASLGNHSVMQTAAVWNSNLSMKLMGLVFPESEFILNRAHYIVTTKEWDPFAIKTHKNGTVSYKGLCVDLLVELSTKLNFSFTIVEPEDGQWGALKNGKWSGMIGQLARKEVELMVGAISIQKEREDVMDFTYPFFQDYTTIILKKPDMSSEMWMKILGRFHWNVLLLLPVCVVVIALILGFSEAYNPINRSETALDGFQRWHTAIWYLLGALLREGGRENCRSHSGRTIIASWWLFGMVIMELYTADLIATLTAPRKPAAIQTLHELVSQSEYKWGVEGGHYLTMLLPNSLNEDYHRAWQGIQQFRQKDEDVLSSNITLHLEKVKRGNYAFFNDKSMLSFEVEKDCESLSLTRESFLPLHFAIGLHNDSLLKDLFSRVILEFHEAGILRALVRKWWPKNITCRSGTKTNTNAIVMSDVKGVFYTITVVIVISWTVMLLEILNQKRKEKARA